MKTRMLFGMAGMVALLAGCGGGADTHEKFVADTISLMSEMNDVLDTVEDEASAKAADTKLQALAKKAEALNARAEKLSKPDTEKVIALAKEYQDKMMKEVIRLNAEDRGMSKFPEAAQKAFRTAMMMLDIEPPPTD